MVGEDLKRVAKARLQAAAPLHLLLIFHILKLICITGSLCLKAERLHLSVTIMTFEKAQVTTVGA